MLNIEWNTSMHLNNVISIFKNEYIFVCICGVCVGLCVCSLDAIQ